MVKFWYISGDFLKDRAVRIGASDIPALIPDPERPTESLAGYGRTPVTLWQEKTGRREREPAGLPAEMGHYLEGKACEIFIRSYAGSELARKHVHDRDAYEFTEGVSAQAFQSTPFHHHAQYHRDGMIVHPDCIYIPNQMTGTILPSFLKITKYGVTFDPAEPCILEAKSANYWAAKRPESSVVHGYDFSLKTWQGIPLRHYVQIQFQLALLEIDTAYLPLIHNTSEFHVWKIAANRSHQGKLIDLAGKMAWHIANDRSPSDMALNTNDIIDLYPTIGDDFVIIEGEERTRAVEIAGKYREAERQAKLWEARKGDARDAMAVLLRDRPELRDALGIIAKWKIVKGSERVAALSKIRDEDPLAYRYLKRKGLLYDSKESRSVLISRDGEGE